MSTTAESSTTTTSNRGGGMDFAPEHLRTQMGIFQVAETIVSLITFICHIVWPYYPGNGWVFFVSGSSFLTIGIHLVIYLFGIRQMKMMNMITITSFCDFAIYCVITGCFFVAGFVAGASGHLNGSVAATAFFAFAATGIYGLDTLIKYRGWRVGQPMSIISDPTPEPKDDPAAMTDGNWHNANTNNK